MNTTFIIYFRNHDTFLCIFNYKVDAEIARYISQWWILYS